MEHSVTTGVISSCSPKYASNPNSSANRVFPCVSLCMLPPRPGFTGITQVLEGPSHLLLFFFPPLNVEDLPSNYALESDISVKSLLHIFTDQSDLPHGYGVLVSSWVT